MTGDGRRTGRIRNDRWYRMYSDMEYILFAFRRSFCGRHAAAYRQPAGRGQQPVGRKFTHFPQFRHDLTIFPVYNFRNGRFEKERGFL